MMRVAYVCADPGVPVFGCKGCSVHVQEVVRALCQQGADVELFVAPGEGPRPRQLSGLYVHPLPLPQSRDASVREREVFHTNAALQAALERRRPFDAIYERYSLWSYAGMEYAQISEIPGLLEVNAPLVEEQKECRKLVNEAAARRIAAWVFSDAAALLPVSEQLANYLQFYGVPAHRIHVTPNGVNPDRFKNVRPARKRAGGTFTVGFLGTLKPWHDLTTLVEAFASLHRRDARYRMLIVGDGPQRSAMCTALAVHGTAVMEAVRFVGAVAPDDVTHWLAAMDVAVAPYSQVAEFYFSPLKVYEYMAAGLPVVATRIGQLAKLIQHGVNGMLTPPDSATSLAETIEVLRQDPLLRRRLGRAARDQVLRDHTWSAVAKRILDLSELPIRRSTTNLT